jgi:hypothetical protein
MAMREAMSVCAKENNALVPSAGQYARWRASSPTGAGAPTPAQIRTEFGSWTRAQSALLGRPEADPTVRRLLTRVTVFSEEQALRGLADFVSSLLTGEYPTAWRYREWAAAVSADSANQARVPATERTIVRIFGSWNEALRTVGVQPEKMRSQRRPREHRFTRDRALDSLRAAGKQLGQPLSYARYDGWVRERDRLRARGLEPAPPDPSANSVCSLLGGWRQALEEAFGDEALIAPGSRPRTYSNEQLIAEYRACTTDVGGAPSQFAYDAWRNERIDRGGTPPPFSHTLSRRIGGGSWSGVGAAAGAELSRSRRSRREYHDPELASWWQACSSELGHLPSQAEYHQWREDKLANDPKLNVPVSCTLTRRIGRGSWRRVAIVMGVHLLGPPNRPHVLTDDQIADALRRCTTDLGKTPSIAEYGRWRAQQPPEDLARCFPHHKTIATRLGAGSWPAAVQSRSATTGGS